MQYLDLHTHSASQKKDVISVQSLSLTDDVLLAIPKTWPIAVGLHPWFAKLERLETNLRDLQIIAKQENVKLIGECGLDKLRGEKMENQLLMLTQQIILAQKLNKPLILHCVRSFSELIALKDKMKVNVPMIIHGFNKSEELGKQLLAKGFLLSFGAGILKPHSAAAKLAQKTDDFFLETDDSETPIAEIYQHVANLKKCSIEVLKARIFANWEKLIK